MVVTGDDNFAMELAREKYVERIRSHHGECTVEMFDSLNERVDAFMVRAMTASLFQDIRLYCVLHAQSLSEKDLASLDKSLDYSIPDVYIFISAEIEKRSAAETKINKALQLKKRSAGGAAVQDCSRPPDYKLGEWIAAQVPPLFNRQIGAAEAEYLADIVEYDLIYSELQKIDLALPPGARIDRGIIEEIAGVTRAMTVYELAAALGKRDLPAALNVIGSLFSANSSFPTPLAVSALFRHFWSMLKIKKFLEKNPQVLKQYNSKGYGKDSPQSAAAFQIGVAAGLLTEKTKNRLYPVIIKPGIIAQAQSFTTAGLRDVIKMLQSFDVEVKTGRTEPSPCNLQMLCYRIARAA